MRETEEEGEREREGEVSNRSWVPVRGLKQEVGDEAALKENPLLRVAS